MSGSDARLLLRHVSSAGCLLSKELAKAFKALLLLLLLFDFSRSDFTSDDITIRVSLHIFLTNVCKRYIVNFSYIRQGLSRQRKLPVFLRVGVSSRNNMIHTVQLHDSLNPPADGKCFRANLVNDEKKVVKQDCPEMSK